MKLCFLFLAIFFVLIFFSKTQAQIIKYAKIKIDLQSKTIEELGILGIPTDVGEYKKNEYFITEISHNDILKINQAGFVFDILIDDVSRYYVERNHPVYEPLDTRFVKEGVYNDLDAEKIRFDELYLCEFENQPNFKIENNYGTILKEKIPVTNMDSTVNNLQSGIYFIHIYSKEKFQNVFKLVIFK